MLLAINSRIFVGCFRLRFKQIHKFVKGVLFVFALFNLQGTVAFRSRGKLAYISMASSICQELFSGFFKFQPVPCLFSPPAGSFRILSHHSLFVKYYFHFFDGFFAKFAEAEFIESRCCWQAAASVFGRRNYSIRPSAPRSHRPLLCRISCS